MYLLYATFSKTMYFDTILEINSNNTLFSIMWFHHLRFSYTKLKKKKTQISLQFIWQTTDFFPEHKN